MNSLGPNIWISHDWEYRYASVGQIYLKKCRNVDQKRAHISSVPVAIEGEHFPTEDGYDSELQPGQDPGEDDKHADDFPEMVSDSLCRNSSVAQTHSFISCPVRVSDDSTGEEARCGDPGLLWLHCDLWL
jgi:hypothetical protein